MRHGKCDCDIAVVGAGHAGIEAALAASRLGFRCICVTLRKDAVGAMSCNPSVGGIAKGQMVREIDALGGQMARSADACGIQFRMLNTGKGPAVQSLRAQEDADLYRRYQRRVLLRQKNLVLLGGKVTAVVARRGAVRGIELSDGSSITARCVIVTAGTFLRGLMHRGLEQEQGGRVGEEAACELSDSLLSLGLSRGRLKTGTPPRLDSRTIHWDILEAQHGDDSPQPFSHFTSAVTRRQKPCYITYTNEKTHDIIRRNLDRSPLYSGIIEGIGPRYCPSIEDKVVKFPDRTHHQVYLEPEGRRSVRVYPNGISTSLPVDVQEEIVHSIEGLREARILVWGYAVEYDFFPPIQIKPSFETKAVRGLYLAGQICGTSGYEEAAGQGLLAGINACLALRNEEPLVLKRSEAYLGVLVDDLCVLSPTEPYRMFTSSAEYRLLLRHDNADLRLMSKGAALGLIPPEAAERLERKRQALSEGFSLLERSWIDSSGALTVLRRPGVRLRDLLRHIPELRNYPPDILRQLEIEGKYSGYIERQKREVARMERWESKRLPPDFDYHSVKTMRKEARERLSEVRPLSVGQARRIAGVRPADIACLLVHLKSRGMIESDGENR